MNHPVKFKYIVALAAAWLAWTAWGDHQALKLAEQHIEQLHQAVQAVFQGR